MAPRASAASQSRSQGGGRKRGTQVEEEEEEDVNMTSEDEATQTQKSGGLSEADLKKRSAKIIRLALALEHMKRPIQRKELMNIIKIQRHFLTVLARVQETLKKTLGMELVELPAKYKVGDELVAETQALTQATQNKKGKGKRVLRDIAEDDEDEDSDEEEEEASQKKKQPKPKTTALWILRSILPPVLLEQMSNPKPINLADRDINAEPINGALVDWEKADGTGSAHVALLGIRTVILCIILASNRVISDVQLHKWLLRLSLERSTVLPYKVSTAKADPQLTLDKYLDLLDKQNYLQKVKRPQPGTADGHYIEWRWGQRQAEFSEEAAAKFIEDVMFHGRDEEDEATQARGRGRNQRVEAGAEGVPTIKEQRVRMRKHLERAAGGEFTGEL